MLQKYPNAAWRMDHNHDYRKLRKDDPSLKAIAAFLNKLKKRYPRFIDIKKTGESVGGNDIFLVEITDKRVPDENKEIPFFYACEHGDEHSATVTLLKVMEWLMTPRAALIREKQKVLIVPCVNPDGYETFHQDNMNGVNLYADYSLNAPPAQPESRAIAFQQKTRDLLSIARRHLPGHG